MEPREYLSVALQRLDLLLHREILRLRANYQLSLDEFRGLYISDEQVNQLVNRPVNYAGPSSAIDELTEKAESLRADAKRKMTVRPGRRWSRSFRCLLSSRIFCCSPSRRNIDLKYETLFAYLNNDITRKWPTFDLALRIGAAVAEQRIRRAPLPVAGSEAVQQRIAATDQLDYGSALMAGDRFFGGAVGLPISLGRSSLDPRLTSFVEQRTPSSIGSGYPSPADLRNGCAASRVATSIRESTLPMVILVGHEGVGRGQAAEAVCRELGVSSLLRVDLDALRAAGENISQLTRRSCCNSGCTRRDCILAPSKLYSIRKESHFQSRAGNCKALTQAKGPVFIPCDRLRRGGSC